MNENNLMKDVLVVITEKSFGCLFLINEDNKIIGVITEGDLGRKITVNFFEMKACQVIKKIIRSCLQVHLCKKLPNL